MRTYPLWKTLLLLLAVVFGVLYAAPNLYGDDPAVQVSRQNGEPLSADFGDRVAALLKADGSEVLESSLEDGQWIVRLPDEERQLDVADALKQGLGRDYVVALNLASKTPAWMEAIGAQPMALGLDLRGGVHFLLEVATDDIFKAAMTRYLEDLPRFLRDQDIRYSGRNIQGDSVVLQFKNDDLRDQAEAVLGGEFPELQFSSGGDATAPTLIARVTEDESKRLVDFAVKQNLTTLRNRVNQLGVAEPIVQRQGLDRIVVELPGVQDTTRVKDLLGATATLEYRAVDTQGDANAAASSGNVPYGDELFYERNGQPVLLKREVIATGAQIVDATSTIDQQSGSPAVSVTLNGRAADKMFDFTQKNVGKPMAVLYKETQITTTYNAKGEPMRERRDVQEVISVATINGIFGKRFQTTGLDSKEAQDLALQLRAGALAAPIVIVEERTIGPSLGRDNINKGFMAALIGFLLVVAYMAVYYRVFGIFAGIALMTNLVLVVAAMSLIQATLTLPGIAGIVLTLGMAVDANVLIYERVREELFAGRSPREAISSGYDRAFLTIADSQITTLIAAVVLFALGTGPVQGFAVTLSIGILTSMFTAIIGSRSLVELTYGRKQRLTDLPV